VSNKYRGEVEFTDSEGTKFVLRLGTNQYLSAEKELAALDGRAFQRRLFHLALVNGGPEHQKKMTLEDAGELLDDLGFIKANELINETKFGSNVRAAEAAAKKIRDEATLTAAKTLSEKISTLRSGVTNSEVLAAMDRVRDKLEEMEVAARAVEGNGNPPQAATSSSN